MMVMHLFLLFTICFATPEVSIDSVANRAAEQCVFMASALQDGRMPKTYQDGRLKTSNLKWWCSGFYPGTCWYTYLLSSRELVKDIAIRQTEKLLDVDSYYQDHDIGFQVMCSSGLAYKITRDEKYLPSIYRGAELLAARFSDTTGVIRSWNNCYSYPVIIDNMMNLELLTFAGKLFNQPRWKEIAIAHAKTTQKNHFRPDYSCWHMVDYNPVDGGVVQKITVQGYSNESSWSRGQAWALYGFTMMYRETGIHSFLLHAQHIASFLMPLLKNKPVPAWDFNAPDSLAGYEDASAAAVMASAFLELGQLSKSKTRSNQYFDVAQNILRTLCSEHYLASFKENSGFIMKHATGHLMKKQEVDVPLTYADYYFVEALWRYKNYIQHPKVQKYITYEQFGAYGDGIHDDMPSIIAAHNAANESGLPVKADGSKTYYIGNIARTAIIKTDVDFGTARFKINDVGLDKRNSSIFEVKSCSSPYAVTGVGKLEHGQKSLGVKLPIESLLHICNDSSKVFIRYGGNQNSGVALQEVIVANKKGIVRDSTDIVWDYDTVTSIMAYPIDKHKLSIKGGIFTTIANQCESRYKYHSRNIVVARSNVVVDGIQHYIVGELNHGAPYSGFIQVENAADVTVSNCVLTAHKTYDTIGSAGTPVQMGSYDLEAYNSINISFNNIKQTNSIDDVAYWGLFSSNFCKCLKMSDCAISRFDAHMGVENVILRRCKFGHMGLRMVGFGTALIENCEVRTNNFISLREDYGSSWNGEIIIKNGNLVPQRKAKEIDIIWGKNKWVHDFGYCCTLPRSIIIDGLRIDDSQMPSKRYKGPFIFSSFSHQPDAGFPMQMEGVVKLSNIILPDGRNLGISSNPRAFINYVVER